MFKILVKYINRINRHFEHEPGGLEIRASILFSKYKIIFEKVKCLIFQMFTF